MTSSSDQEPKYVGGREESPSRPYRGVWTAVATTVGLMVLIASLAILQPWRGLSLASQPPARGTNGQPEPAAASAFVRAFHDKDPQGMRAAVSPQCIADPDAALCRTE